MTPDDSSIPGLELPEPASLRPKVVPVARPGVAARATTLTHDATALPDVPAVGPGLPGAAAVDSSAPATVPAAGAVVPAAAPESLEPLQTTPHAPAPVASAASNRRAPRGLGAAPPRVVPTVEEALAAARTERALRPPPVVVVALETVAAEVSPVRVATPTLPPPSPAVATVRAPMPRSAPSARGGRAPRGLGMAPAVPALSAAEALEAARRLTAEPPPPAAPSPATTVTPRPVPVTSLEPQEIVQDCFSAWLPEADAWVVEVLPASRRRDLSTWAGHRARACVTGDLPTALASTAVLDLLERRAQDVAFARVASVVGEHLVVVDLAERRPVATLPSPLGWGLLFA